nr:hypothetical protein [Escherichia coli]
MEYDAAGRVIRLTSENGSHTTFRYDVLDRLIQETGFDGRTQRYHHDLTGKLIRSEDEGLVTHWHYDEADRLTHRTVKGETAELNALSDLQNHAKSGYCAVWRRPDKTR